MSGNFIEPFSDSIVPKMVPLGVPAAVGAIRYAGTKSSPSAIKRSDG